MLFVFATIHGQADWKAFLYVLNIAIYLQQRRKFAAEILALSREHVGQDNLVFGLGGGLPVHENQHSVSPSFLYAKNVTRAKILWNEFR